MNTELNVAARRIFNRLDVDISDRCGLGNEWEQISPNVKNVEIRSAWEQIITEEVEKHVGSNQPKANEPTHTPKPLYSCHLCAEDASWPAGDLNWCEKCAQWMCDLCWDYEEHGEKGIRLDHHLMKGSK